MSDVLLLHAGICDARMWEPQLDVLRRAGFRVLAPDLRGFGERRLEAAPFSHLHDVEAVLGGPTAVVGASLGGRVALELALHRPELVERLVVVAPGLPRWEWSDATRAGWAEEEAAYERGDLDAAAEACLRMWLDEGYRAAAVDPGVRAAVRTMVLRSYEQQQGAWEAGADEVELPGGPLHDRLGEIRCPTLVIVGARDRPDMQAAARHVAQSIPGAQLAVVEDAAHLPALERPAEVNPLLLRFLGASSGQ